MSHGQMTRSGPPALGLGKRLTTHHCKKTNLLWNVTQCLRQMWPVAGPCNHSNKPFSSI